MSRADQLAARWPACRARRCAPSGRGPSGQLVPTRHSVATPVWRARSARSRARTPARRLTRPQQASPPHPCHRSMPRGKPRRSSGIPCGPDRTSPRSRPQPIERSCPHGNRCRHSACRVLLTDLAVGRENCGRDAGRSPCRCAPAYDRTRIRSGPSPARGAYAAPTRTCRSRGIACRRYRQTPQAWRYADRGNRCRSRRRRTSGSA